MWLDPVVVDSQLAFYLADPPLMTIDNKCPNYERNAFDGDVYRHSSDVRAVVIHETNVAHTMATSHKDHSFMQMMFGTRRQPDLGNYRPTNIYINREGQVYVVYYYPTRHIEHSPELWNIPLDGLNQFGFSITIEANNDVSDMQFETAVRVAAAILDAAGLGHHRIVSNLQQSFEWASAVKGVQELVQVADVATEFQIDVPEVEQPDQPHSQ